MYTDKKDAVFSGTPSDLGQSTDDSSPPPTMMWTPTTTTDKGDKRETRTASHDSDDSFCIGITRVTDNSTKDQSSNLTTTSSDVDIAGKIVSE